MARNQHVPGLSIIKVDGLFKPRTKVCERCRIRKRKCTMEKPSCSNCLKHGCKCIYLSDETDRVVVKRRPTTPAEIVKLSGKLKKRQYSSPELSTGVVSCDAVNPVMAKRIASAQSVKLAQLRYELQELQSRASLKSEWMPVDTSRTIDSALFPKKVCTDSGCSAVCSSDRKGKVYTNIMNSSIFRSGVSTKADLGQLHSLVPAKRICDDLVHRFRTSVHPIVPLIEWTEFYPLYESFWDDSSVATIGFFIHLFAILYAACVSKYEENSFDEEDYSDIGLLNKLVAAAEIALSMYGFPRQISVEGLEASVILHTALRNDCRTDDSGSIGALVRLAQTIGLHRDPLKFHKIDDMRKVQHRRLLWWHLYYLDTSTAQSNRMIPIVGINEFDTLLPSEHSRDVEGNFLFNQAIAFANGRFRWAECTNRILHATFNVKPMMPEDCKALDCEIENLSFYCSSLIQRILDPANAVPSQEKFTQFSTNMLSTLADRCHLLLHIGQATNQSPSPTGIDTSSVGDISIEDVDTQFVEQMIHLLQGFCEYGSMPANKMFIWEIRKFQPIQVMLALLNSLLAQAKQSQVENDTLDFANDPKTQIIQRSLNELSYMSRRTTQLCKDRWTLLKEVKEATFNQLSILPQDASSTTSEDSSELATKENWYDLLHDLDKLQEVISDNINVELWDQSAGHYLT